jgi:hypothetical protein
MSYDAKNYALLIKREVVALDTLLENWAEIQEDIERVRNGDAPEMDDELLAECVGAQNALEIEWPDDEGADIVGDYLNNTCLDIEVWRKVGDTDGATRCEILRTCGGPRCDILRDSNNGSIVEIRVYSGSDSHTLRVNAGTLADYLDELAGGF